MIILIDNGPETFQFEVLRCLVYKIKDRSLNISKQWLRSVESVTQRHLYHNLEIYSDSLAKVSSCILIQFKNDTTIVCSVQSHPTTFNRPTTFDIMSKSMFNDIVDFISKYIDSVDEHCRKTRLIISKQMSDCEQRCGMRLGTFLD